MIAAQPPFVVFNVLGVDPGPTKVGHCLLAVRTELRRGTRHIVSAEVKSGTWCSADMNILPYRHHTYVEKPCGIIYERKRGPELLAAAIVAGEWFERARTISARRDYITAAQWRGALLRTATGSDKQVRALVDGLSACGFLTGLEHVNHEARPHVYDAIGAALGGLVYYGVAKIVLPSSVEVDILKAKANDKQKRKAKAARKSRVVGR